MTTLSSVHLVDNLLDAIKMNAAFEVKFRTFKEKDEAWLVVRIEIVICQFHFSLTRESSAISAIFFRMLWILTGCRRWASNLDSSAGSASAALGMREGRLLISQIARSRVLASGEAGGDS